MLWHRARMAWWHAVWLVAVARKRAGGDAGLLLAVLVPLAVTLIVAGVLFALGISPGWAAIVGCGVAIPTIAVCACGARYEPEIAKDQLVGLKVKLGLLCEDRTLQRATQTEQVAGPAFAVEILAKSQPDKNRDYTDAPIKHYYTTLAGLNHLNLDGSDRRRLARECRCFQRLVLRHEPENVHDTNAVIVERPDGAMLGYIPAHVAANMAWQREDRGWKHVAVLAGFTKPTPTFPKSSPLLAVLVIEGETPESAVDEYINRNIVRARKSDVVTEWNPPRRMGCSVALLLSLIILILICSR